MVEYEYINCREYKRFRKVLHRMNFMGRELFIHRSESFNPHFPSYVVTDLATGMLLVNIKTPTEKAAIMALNKISERKLKLAWGRKLFLAHMKKTFKAKPTFHQWLKQHKKQSNFCPPSCGSESNEPNCPEYDPSEIPF